jgi:peptidoglycan/xylan/chitin deacetylase (PgdA/CDA1 family)
VLSALCYHSVGDPGPGYLFDPDVIDVTPAQFREQLSILARHCTVIGIDQLCQVVAGEIDRLPPNPVLITFDDGYRTCIDLALPILKEFGFPATFFIATDYVTNRRLYWWEVIHYLINSSKATRITLEKPRHLELDLADRKAAIGRLIRLVKDEYDLELDGFIRELAASARVEWNREIEASLADQLVMTWDDIRALHRAGMDIESHTRSHRVLQTLQMEHLADELAGSRADLERELGEPVRTVAYPVGYSIRHIPKIRMAVKRAGYKIGFTSATGTNYLWRQPLDPFDIRRISMQRDISVSLFLGGLAIPPLAFSRETA